MIKFIALLLIAIAPSLSQADGNKLLEYCIEAEKHLEKKEVNNPFSIGFCLGMIQGVRNTLIIINEIQPKNLQLCWPDGGINNSQAVRILLNYLRSNPENLHKDEVLLTMLSFQKAYKCSSESIR